MTVFGTHLELRVTAEGQVGDRSDAGGTDILRIALVADIGICFSHDLYRGSVKELERGDAAGVVDGHAVEIKQNVLAL